MIATSSNWFMKEPWVRRSSKDCWKTVVVNKRSVFWTARSGPWHVFLNPRKFVVFAVRHQDPIGNPRCIPRIRPVYNRDDFYDPGPLTSSPTPIPSGVLCGDNSSLSYIVARRCRACAVCARLSCRIPLRSGLRTRCGVFFSLLY